MLVIEIDPKAGVSKVFVRAENDSEEDLALRCWQGIRSIVDSLDLKLKADDRRNVVPLPSGRPADRA